MTIIDHRRGAVSGLIPVDYIRKIKINFVAWPICHEDQAVAIAYFASDRRDPHRDLGCPLDFAAVMVFELDLNEPETESDPKEG
jgi:hypothetical protein